VRIPVISGLVARYRAAARTAEALAWRHGAAGVDAAFAALALPSEDYDFDLLVAWLTDRRLAKLKRAGPAKRDRLLQRWLRRPGQLIAPDA
jgi:hypothetical protein